MRELSGVLARHGVNIDELSTETWDAPMAGGMLFEADAMLEAPADLDEATLRVALESVAQELMVDIELDTDLSP